MLSAYRKEGALISTQRLKELMRIEDPEGADSREFQGRRRRGRMDVVGPNRFFALDGYDKFLEWGFKIYGWIDGYSRFLPQLYCGIDNKTAISIWIRTRRLYRKLGYMTKVWKLHYLQGRMFSFAELRHALKRLILQVASIYPLASVLHGVLHQGIFELRGGGVHLQGLV
jgi:hypothetical protein